MSNNPLHVWSVAMSFNPIHGRGVVFVDDEKNCQNFLSKCCEIFSNIGILTVLRGRHIERGPWLSEDIIRALLDLRLFTWSGVDDWDMIEDDWGRLVVITSCCPRPLFWHGGLEPPVIGLRSEGGGQCGWTG